MTTLNCTAYDFYSYNNKGSLNYRGERSHFHVYVNEPGLFTFQCNKSLPHLIIVSPIGRVIYKKSYKADSNIKWKASDKGIYLFKLWTEDIEDTSFYQVTWNALTSENKLDIEKIEQQIWSGATSNKDGTLYDHDENTVRKNGIQQFSKNERLDRIKQHHR